MYQILAYEFYQGYLATPHQHLVSAWRLKTGQGSQCPLAASWNMDARMARGFAMTLISKANLPRARQTTRGITMTGENALRVRYFVVEIMPLKINNDNINF